MTLTDNFKTLISSTFYDKVITKYTQVNVTDTEGWTAKDAVTSNGTFKGNVNFSKLDEIRKDYGLNDEIDMVVTCDEDIENGSILEYLGVKYLVVRAIPYDSHYLLIGKKWLSKSKTLPSA